MTTVAKCPVCNAILLRPGDCPYCADAKSRRTEELVANRNFRARRERVTTPEMEKVWKAIAGAIDDYRREHPAASIKEACLAILKDRGLLSSLPASIQRSADDDTDDEIVF
jgi:hypothetical protein